MCASGACAACAGSAATTSAWLTSCVASAKSSVGIAARSATQGPGKPGARQETMRHERCLGTHRLSGPCTLCRQPTWPAQVRGFQQIYRGAVLWLGRWRKQATIPAQ